MRLFALCLLLASPGCASLGAASAPGDGDGPAPGLDRPMPELSLRPLQGRAPIRLGALRGKVVLVDLWASWCAPCREELPLLDDLARRLRGQGLDVAIIAVSVDEDRAAAEELVRGRARWHLTMAHDPDAAEVLKPAAMPSSYLIDARGRLQEINAGFRPGDIERLEARMRALAGRR
jgi:cytochrome c biogenesis protein CcmG, thiol:disulfide interchange protein DsbE